jgi:hypothetical protein
MNSLYISAGSIGANVITANTITLTNNVNASGITINNLTSGNGTFNLVTTSNTVSNRIIVDNSPGSAGQILYSGGPNSNNYWAETYNAIHPFLFI